MEEKVVGGKEKKYVLYTVVGEERGRAGVGVWVVRVLLGTLLLVALAVVPYLSLRLAQVSDRTLVVFQPMPVHNHSYHHHHDRHHQPEGVIQYGKLGHVISVPVSAALTNHSHNDTAASTAPPPTAPANTSQAPATPATQGLVTLHEVAVTLAVMEDTNATRPANDTDEDATTPEDDAKDDEKKDDNKDDKKDDKKEDKKEAEDAITTEAATNTSETPASASQAATATPATPAPSNATHAPSTTPAPTHANTAPPAATVTPSTPAPAAAVTPAVPSTPPSTPANTTGKTPAAKVVNATTPSTTPSTTAATSSTTRRTTTTTTSPHRLLAHKLVYMATSASGNHAAGFCVWKTDKNVTRWSYFFENIPIEYQSHQDSADHEMRGMLAAVRTWAPLWNDHHVVLRSHHPSITGSDHPTRRALTRVLEQLSEGSFSYELEWRFRKTDRVVDIAYCLSRLHRDFRHWFLTFQGRVDELLGPQNWKTAREENRAHVTQEAFITNYSELEDETRNETK